MHQPLFDHHLLADIKLNEHCLINITSIPKKVINLYIYYTPSPCLRNLNKNFALKGCLCRSVKLTKHADSDKYKSSGYNIELDSRSDFSFTDGSRGTMSLLLELTWAHLSIFMISEKISSFMMMNKHKD